ncbi:MAG: NADH-quinone oxidoreductase subunit NuoN, partial [Alphaproteobacteria bacterium]
MTALVPNWFIALPEIVMALGLMAFLVLGVVRGDQGAARLARLSVLLMFVVGLLVIAGDATPARDAFGGLFIVDAFAQLMKCLILVGAAAAILMALSYLRFEGILRFEFPILVLTAALGMMMMVSAGNLIALYLGLELQSLSLYVLAALHRDQARSTEAGLKYFVLGALASGMLLYGVSLIYGFTGTTSFAALAGSMPAMLAGGTVSLGLVFGLVFVLAGLAFKISAVPFHMWTPDVYEGAPTPITAFFAGAPKIAAFALLLRVLFDPLAAMIGEWRQIVIFIAIASMLLGAVAAIAQTNIKRLMAYSSIGHVGYALVGIAAGTAQGVSAVILYLTVYLSMTIGTFICILAMRRATGMVEDITELAGLYRSRPRLAATLAILMLSLIGFPPFAGFFAKLYVFRAAVEAGLY